MFWLRAITVLFMFLAAFGRPASASAFVAGAPATSGARVSAFELVALASVGASAETSPGLHEGIGRAYGETASGYRFAARGLANPSTIRFSQNSISRTFRSGGTLRETIEGLRSGAIAPESIPAIRVFERGGRTFTLDNRRLFVFQEAGIPIRTVPATAQEVAAEAFKFTTTNEGASIVVRGGL